MTSTSNCPQRLSPAKILLTRPTRLCDIYRVMANNIKRITLFAGTTGVVGENDDTVLQRIWAKFQTKAISRASDGRVLTYYGFYDVNRNGVWDEGTDTDRNSPAKCPFSSAAELVSKTNGQCHSWAEFMYQVLCANGLKFINGHQTLFVSVFFSSRMRANSAIKNWEKRGTGPWTVIGGSAGITGVDVIPTIPEHHTQDIAGVAAQGNSPNPPPRFDNHWIVNAAARYYDPSYGIGSFTNTNLYEQAALDGIIFDGKMYNLQEAQIKNSYFLFCP